MSHHLNPRGPTPHGFTEYARCSRCGTERPESELTFTFRDDAPVVSYCADVAWCGRQMGMGLDANGDAEVGT